MVNCHNAVTYEKHTINYFSNTQKEDIMIYKDFQGKKLSALGLGAMRLPVINGNDAEIDEAAAAEIVAYAMEHGINYYDTAWGYHGGQSEIVIGKILKKYPRDSYYIATKFPGYDLSNMTKVEEIFEKQLKKTGMEYFDFYLFHCLTEGNIDHYLDKKYGIFDYLMEQKKNGRIKHLGLSVHCSCDTLKRFLDAYGENMEFCQVQLNYLDWSYQKAEEIVKLLNENNIPIWVMEPLRGGKLVNLADKYEERLKALRPEESILAWAFRYLQSISGVEVVLSGMSNLEQLKENIEIFNTDKPLNDNEMDTLLGIVDEMVKTMALPCTSCRYCTTYCPKEIDIPKLLGLYSEDCILGGGFLAPFRLEGIPKERQPDACIGCRRCEAVCPQQIKISEVMVDFVNRMKK